jgi:hypothetical protein
MSAPNGSAPKYTIVVHNVREVSLYGRADLAYWREYLQREGLTPFDDHDQAQVLLIAAEMVWMGVRFSELSVSVALAQPGAEDQRMGMYLIQAFNSVRWFAWVERTLFQTPYYHAQTRVSAQAPVSIELRDGQAQAICAALASTTPCASRGPAAFTGPVYLPSALTGTPRAEKFFLAELSGQTEIYPFAPASDTLRLAASPRTAVVGYLQASHFAGQEWHVRAAATHKKSQTRHASE